MRYVLGNCIFACPGNPETATQTAAEHDTKAAKTHHNQLSVGLNVLMR